MALSQQTTKDEKTPFRLISLTTHVEESAHIYWYLDGYILTKNTLSLKKHNEETSLQFSSIRKNSITTRWIDSPTSARGATRQFAKPWRAGSCAAGVLAEYNDWPIAFQRSEKERLVCRS